MVNHLVMQGRMVADPELKTTNSGAQVVNFRIAWSEKYKERENKCFLECKAFGPQAEFICKYFRKGQEINIEGKLMTEEWETQDGQKRSKNVLIVERPHFSGKKQDDGPSKATSGNTTGGTYVETDELPF